MLRSRLVSIRSKTAPADEASAKPGGSPRYPYRRGNPRGCLGLPPAIRRSTPPPPPNRHASAAKQSGGGLAHDSEERSDEESQVPPRHSERSEESSTTTNEIPLPANSVRLPVCPSASLPVCLFVPLPHTPSPRHHLPLSCIHEPYPERCPQTTDPQQRQHPSSPLPACPFACLSHGSAPSPSLRQSLHP